ncbi:hypothetical protein KW500_18485 [Vibrio fluvialis]|nr:hypothetical protein [Vibrio fluvialis]
MSKPIIPTKSIEVTTMSEAMPFYYGNQSKASRMTGINRQVIAKCLDKHSDYDIKLLVVRGEDGEIIRFEPINW